MADGGERRLIGDAHVDDLGPSGDTAEAQGGEPVALGCEGETSGPDFDRRSDEAEARDPEVRGQVHHLHEEPQHDQREETGVSRSQGRPEDDDEIKLS